MIRYSIPLLASVLLSTLVIIQSQNPDKPAALTQNPCTSKTNCSSCIQTQSCAWCMQPDFGDRPRCFQPDLKPSTLCSEEFVVNPDNEEIMLKNLQLTRAGYELSGGGMASGGSYSEQGSYSSSGSAKGSASGGGSASGSASGGSGASVVQISPQHVNLRLRVNEKHSLKVSYAQAEDYPVDLYYLMDLSKSMEDDKAKLSSLGDLLSDTMRNITSNFRLGFGSFVDKVLMPYVSTVPKNLVSPCDGCEAPYGYHNVMKLSTDTRRFAKNVNESQVSGNLDAPEGGFDAIMQAVVCKEEIGWRHKARRLLLFSTDAGFHYAGDGKLGGVITPNDGKCHMKANEYTHSSKQDYPSISQINLKVKENAINIIFAVTQSQYEVYRELSKHIEGSSSAVLSDDSSNIVELVRDEYNKITSSIEMKDTASGSIKVSYWSKCLGETRQQTNKCDGLKVGDVVAFETEIVVTSCPADPNLHKQIFTIYPVGVSENITVEVDMLCSCDCEFSGPTFELNSPICKGDGTLSCGICDCHEGFFGRNCECSNTGPDQSAADALKCFANNVTDVECSGKGTCVCGQCSCNKRDNPEERIYGQFCECDNFSCDRDKGVICSGNGVCDCGVCKCNDDFSGPACQCSTSIETCTASNGEICSGHGTCECGACKCDITEDVRYSGTYCEKCPTCPGRCEELRACVECQMYKKGPLKDPEDCARNCTLFVPIDNGTIEYDENKFEHLCTFYDEDDCRYSFVYNETVHRNGSVSVEVYAQRHPECPPKVFLLGIILGVIAAIVLIGLAMLLLWKLVTTIHDRREFARFEKERMMAKWDTGENPIYKQATSTFKNPTYAGK